MNLYVCRVGGGNGYRFVILAVKWYTADQPSVSHETARPCAILNEIFDI